MENPETGNIGHTRRRKTKQRHRYEHTDTNNAKIGVKDEHHLHAETTTDITTRNPDHCLFFTYICLLYVFGL